MNINGRQSYVSKLDRLIAEHETILAALKLTRGLLNDEVREKKLTSTNGALTEALASEARRRGPYTKHRAHRKAQPFGHSVIAKQRARSEEFLAQFDTKKPTLPPSNGTGHSIAQTALGPMVRRGYLAKKGDGYIRTAKPYIVDPNQAWKHKASTNGHGHRTERQRRQITADFLTQFDTETPKAVKSTLLSALLRTGYLKHKGDGYVRTAKEFVVVRDARD